MSPVAHLNVAPDVTRETGAEANPWSLLVVDDDEGVIAVTRLALRDLTFDGRRVEIHEARSGAEARAAMQRLPVDVILLDVVMESEHAGLDFVNYVRRDLRDAVTRIILRTGQPGSHSPLELVTDYDIDGYCAKGQVTALDLKIEVLTSLRNVSLLRRLQSGQPTVVELG